MRTTIRLDDELLSQAKQHALETRITLTALIEDALRERLRRGEDPRRNAEPVRLTTRGGTGLLSGVDLDDSAALLDAMDERP